ncbi:MAG: hypothetical protein AAF766_24855 [Cyanobacteria bacterium P01_D01_bin.14]
MSRPSLRPLERISTQTLLGIRFWDRLIEQPIAQGLQVMAQRVDGPTPTRRLGKPVLGRITPSGTVAFFGLSALERLPAGSETLDLSTLEPQYAAIDLVDLRGRYLPMSFVVQIPWPGPFLGELQPEDDASSSAAAEEDAAEDKKSWLTTPLLRPDFTKKEPLTDSDEKERSPGVYLWSAPTRIVPPGTTTIRAQLVLGAGDDPPPAAHALVEVVQSGDSMPPDFNYFGLADERGSLLLPLPYPPINNDFKLPPLATQTFNLTLRVYYDPARQQTLPGSAVPRLTTLLGQDQAASATSIGTHFDGAGLQTADSLAVALPFDQPLVLRTGLGSLETKTQESVLRLV